MQFKSLVSAVVLTAVSSSVFAGDWYVTGHVGQAEAKDESAHEVDADLIDLGVTGLVSSLDDTDTGYKLQLGYMFTPYWGLEGGYVDLGNVNYNASFTGPVAGNATAEVEVYGWNIAAVGNLPISDAFALYGKLGVINAKVKIDIQATGAGESLSVSDSDTGADPNWGFGAVYNVTDQVGVRLEWERFNSLGDKEKTGEGDVDLLSLGVKFTF